MHPFRIAVLIAFIASVGGCVLPPALTIASLVADGISMASSGKTVTDQAVSVLLQKDCRLWRLVRGKSICGSDASVVAIAALPPPVPPRAASPGLRPTDPLVAVAAPVETLSTEPAVPSTAMPEPLPAASRSQTETAAPAAATPRPRIPTVLAAPPLRAPPASVAAAPLPMRHAAGDARMHGEMVIRSGTDETEARALADSLHAVGATVRPVRHGDITIYEVVMGLSG